MEPEELSYFYDANRQGETVPIRPLTNARENVICVLVLCCSHLIYFLCIHNFFVTSKEL